MWGITEVIIKKLEIILLENKKNNKERWESSKNSWRNEKS